jgi:hypothetical protein
MDFSQKNYYAVPDMEATLKRVIFPDTYSKEERFDLRSEDYTFLKDAMRLPPAHYPFYRHPDYFPAYVKFLYYGSNPYAQLDPDITVYNKVGNAYGYLIDCAYFENRKLGIGFFLTAVIHCNADQIYNDGKYEYDEIGYPYMERLGKAIYQLEVDRIKK